MERGGAPFRAKQFHRLLPVDALLVDRGVLKQSSPCRVWLVSHHQAICCGPHSHEISQQMDGDLPTTATTWAAVDSLRQGWRCWIPLGLVGCLSQRMALRIRQPCNSTFLLRNMGIRTLVL